MTLINPYIFGSGVVADVPTTDLALHLRASTIAQADGTAVSAWADQSVNGRNAAQATGANQPTYKTAILNGQDVVRFDGSNDHMTGSAWSFNDEMVFIVMNVRSAPTGGFFSRGTTGNDWDTRNGLAFESDTGTKFRGTYGHTALADSGLASLTRPADGTWAIYEHTLNAGTQRVAYNRSQGAATDTYTTGVSSPTSYTIASRWLSGAPGNFVPIDVAEIVAYSTYDATRRTDALDVLAARYGITLV